MSKEIIKQTLTAIWESETPGIDVTADIHKQNGKINKKGVSDMAKDLSKEARGVVETDVEAVKKWNYNSKKEKEYHEQMEILNGQEMIQYDREPNKEFLDRAKEGITGSSRMGNPHNIGNGDQKTNDMFSKELEKRIKDSIKKRNAADRAYLALGDDIELLPKDEKGKGRNYAISEAKSILAKGYTHFLVGKNPANTQEGKIYDGWDYKGLDNDEIKEWVKIDVKDNFPSNKASDFKLMTRKGLISLGIDPSNTNNWYKIEQNQNINEAKTMKRLTFKQELTNEKTAIKLIPESYKVDNKEFEMTDGNQSYLVRWEGSLNEGSAVILASSNKTLVQESIAAIKHKFNYKSEDTLGTLKGNQRINENDVFKNMFAKAKQLIKEAQNEEGFDDDAVGYAPEAKEHIEGSVPTDKKTEAPAPKEGEWQDADVTYAPEAHEHIEGSVPEVKKTEAPAPKEGNWHDIKIKQAPEAKEHVHMNESEDKDGEKETEEVPENKEDYTKQPGYVHESKLMYSKKADKYYIVSEAKTIECPKHLVESAKKDVKSVAKILG